MKTKSSHNSDSWLTASQRDTLWRWVMRLACFVSLIVLWEWVGRTQDNLLLASFSQTMVAGAKLAVSRELYQALWISNQAMLLGFAAALLFAVPLGLLLGRLQWLERFADIYLNILIVIPMAAIIPLIILAVGLGLLARVLVVFMFAFPIITVNTRAGLKNLDPTLIEMARSFGATELQLWRRILLPGAAPAIIAGVQLGLARSLSGMVVVELLLVAVGLGKIILGAIAFFEPETAYAVVGVIILEVMVLQGIVRWIKRRLISWQDTS